MLEIQRRFTPIHVKALQFAQTDATYWIRFSIDNPYPNSRSAIVALSNQRFGNIELYDISKSGTYVNIPPPKKWIPEGRYLQAYPHLIYLPGKTTSSFLMKVEATGFLNSEIRLISPSQYVQNEEFYSALQALIFGWLLATCAYFLHILISRRFSLAGYAALYCATGSLLGNVWIGQFSFPGITDIDLVTTASVTLSLMILSRSMIFYNISWVGPTAMRSRHLSLAAFAIPAAALAMNKLFETNHIESLLPAAILTSELILLITALSGDTRARNSASVLIISCTIAVTVAAGVLLSNFNWVEMGILASWSTFILPLIVSASLVVLMLLQLNQPITGLRTSTRGGIADSRLLEKITQEITTPITSFIGAKELLEDSQLTDNQKEYVEGVALASLELQQVSNELADMAQVHDEHLLLTKSPFDIEHAIIPIIIHFRRRAQQRKVELLLDYEDDFNTHMLGDETRFKTLIYNTIRGLIDHLEEGCLSMHLANTDVGRLDGVCVYIRMTGKISKRDKLQAFIDSLSRKVSLDQRLLDNPWHQLILQQLLNFMKVAVEMETVSNRLASLTFYIPLERAPTPQTTPPQYDDSLVGDGVLIVNDNAQLRKVLDKQVRRWGVRTQCTHNGKEALAILRNQCLLNQPFDTLIMDQEMSTISPLDLALKIREDEEIIPKPALIMLTNGSHNSHLYSVAEDAGIQQLVERPVISERLRLALMSLKNPSNNTPH